MADYVTGVSRPRLGAAADQVHVLRAEPGRDAVFAVGDDERIAVPRADSMTSTRNSNSRFACRWLRAPDLNPGTGPLAGSQGTRRREQEPRRFTHLHPRHLPHRPRPTRP